MSVYDICVQRDPMQYLYSMSCSSLTDTPVNTQSRSRKHIKATFWRNRRKRWCQCMLRNRRKRWCQCMLPNCALCVCPLENAGIWCIYLCRLIAMTHPYEGLFVLLMQGGQIACFEIITVHESLDVEIDYLVASALHSHNHFWFFWKLFYCTRIVLNKSQLWV